MPDKIKLLANVCWIILFIAAIIIIASVIFVAIFKPEALSQALNGTVNFTEHPELRYLK